MEIIFSLKQTTVSVRQLQTRGGQEFQMQQLWMNVGLGQNEHQQHMQIMKREVYIQEDHRG